VEGMRARSRGRPFPQDPQPDAQYER
jgi:hypothetical protein